LRDFDGGKLDIERRWRFFDVKQGGWMVAMCGTSAMSRVGVAAFEPALLLLL